MSENKSITDVVRNSPQLQNAIKELKKNRLLLDGIFDPRAYLRDTDKIGRAWKKEKSRINAIAMGVSLYNDMFYQAVSRHDFPSRKERAPVNKWRSEVKKIFPKDHGTIDEICLKIGQYLEYMNRKAQGF